jgi:hypothetical protein
MVAEGRCTSFSCMTLKRAFLMTENAMPAEMSPTSAPSFCACLTFEFIKTVQRVPRSTGARELRRRAARTPPASCAAPRAKFWMKEPQPAEQASLSVMLPMLPSLHEEAFHILPADVEHEGDLRAELLRRAQVRERLDLAAVRVDAGFDDLLAIACRHEHPAT